MRIALCAHFVPAPKKKPRLSAGNALATTVTTRTDPTWGTTAATSISPTCRQFDNRGCVLERMDAGSSVLRARLQGHCPQYERRRRQRHHEFSHKDPPSLQDYQNGEKHAQYIPFLEPRRAFSLPPYSRLTHPRPNKKGAGRSRRPSIQLSTNHSVPDKRHDNELLTRIREPCPMKLANTALVLEGFAPEVDRITITGDRIVGQLRTAEEIDELVRRLKVVRLLANWQQSQKTMRPPTEAAFPVFSSSRK
jgi:hypothetical protein